jgi:hypothetical protein
MADTLKPCCERTLRESRSRYEELAMSYPVIKDFPCPTCSQVLKLRIYGPPEEDQETFSA